MLVGWLSQAAAKVDVLAEYRLGASTPQITYTGGPETIADATGNEKRLKRQGSPRFVASAPSVPSAKGAGALEFDGKNDAYVRDGALFGLGDRFGLEVWVSAAEAAAQGLKGVVANGNGALGYVLGQSGNRWVAFVGCVGAFDLGPVTPARWTHLALVNDGKELAAYLNGEKIRGVSPTPGIAPFFRIGTAGLADRAFQGANPRGQGVHVRPGPVQSRKRLPFGQREPATSCAAEARRAIGLHPPLVRSSAGRLGGREAGPPTGRR